MNISLSLSHSIRSNDRYIHASKHYRVVIFSKENVGRLYISMKNVHIVRIMKPFQSFKGNFPDGAFTDQFFIFLVFLDQLENIYAFKQLSNNAKSAGKLIVERILVGKYSGVLDASEYSHLI